MKSRLLASLIAGLCLAVSGNAGLPQNSMTGSGERVGPIESQEVDRGNSREEEHESNGPAGSAGVPMQGLPLVGILLAVVVLGITWQLMPREKT